MFYFSDCIPCPQTARHPDRFNLSTSHYHSTFPIYYSEAIICWYFQQCVGFLIRYPGSGIASSSVPFARHHCSLGVYDALSDPESVHWPHSGTLGWLPACRLTPLHSQRVGIQDRLSAASPYCCHSNTLFCLRLSSGGLWLVERFLSVVSVRLPVGMSLRTQTHADVMLWQVLFSVGAVWWMMAYQCIAHL